LCGFWRNFILYLIFTIQDQFYQMDNSPRSTEKTPPYTPAIRKQADHYVWRPGVFRRAPWVALIAIVFGIASAAASAVIIVISNEHAATWKVQPSVLLGFLAGFSTTMLVVALSSGVTITWWRAAFDPRGTTMAKLHYIWKYGGGGSSTPWLAGKHVNKVAVASILTAITGVAYGPLLQRASRTESRNLSSKITMSLDIYSQLPTGYAGTVGDTPGGLPLLSTAFLSDIQYWYSQSGITTWDFSPYFCNGTCAGSVLTAGLQGADGGCNMTKQPLDLRAAADDGTEVFSINFSRYDDQENIPTLEMTFQYITNVTSECSATLVTEVCRLQAATVTYPIIIQNDIVNINTSIYDVLRFGEPYADPGDLSTAPEGSPAGPLSALQWFGTEYYWSNATLHYNSSTEAWWMTSLGIPAHQYFDTDSDDYVPSITCGFQWNDPTVDIFSDFYQVLFYAAFDDDNWGADDVTQNFTAVQTQSTLVYHSEYGYLAGASALVLLALIGVSTTLYGWWELGRNVSLSPLETAKALGAELFRHYPHWNTHMDGGNLAKDMGHRRFRYGEQMVPEGDGVEKPTLGIGELGIGNDPAEPKIPQLVFV
jgi:hypothetical protein